MPKKTLVYIHRNIFYDHDEPHNATMADAVDYLKSIGEDSKEWNVLSFAGFDNMLNQGDITPETPVHFITKRTR